MASRTVKLRINASVPLLTITGVQPADIRNLFVNNGWNIIEVQALTRSYYPTEPIDYLIVAQVENQHDDTTVISVANALLSQILNVYNIAIVPNSNQEPLVVASTNPNAVNALSLGEASLIGGLSLTTVLLIALGVVVVLKRK